MGALNIAALSRRTGVPADTIRKWEQRYGVLRPQRTTGGQRRYTEQDVARLTWLTDRLAEGYRIGEAATMLGDGQTDPPLTLPEHRRALISAVERNEVETMGRLVDQALTLLDPSEAFTEVLSPVLVEVGERWEAGDLTVAQEHLVSTIVRASLEKLLADTRPTVRGLAVLACAPGERHEIALLMLAVLLRADGWNVAYLGPDTPVAETVALAGEVGASAICFSAGTPESARALAAGLRGVELPGGLEVVIGGRGALADRSMTDAVERLRGAAPGSRA
jgi:DNA-binding transcriptional MerR regulator